MFCANLLQKLLKLTVIEALRVNEIPSFSESSHYGISFQNFFTQSPLMDDAKVRYQGCAVLLCQLAVYLTCWNYSYFFHPSFNWSLTFKPCHLLVRYPHCACNKTKEMRKSKR